MTERPIFFRGSMVRRILAGAKTQTRRLVRIDDTPISEAASRAGRRQKGIPSNAQNVRLLGDYLKCDAPPGSFTVSARVLCPYGTIGDRFWVKETFQRSPDGIIFRATASEHGAYDCGGEGPWTPSIFMPRSASRLTLEVTEIRVQRLLQITEEDARAEGVEPFFEAYSGIGRDQRLTTGELAADAEHRASFACLWDEINGNRALWITNPWVWAISFKVVSP